MKRGTKSLLFGVHQFAWHPLVVWAAWVWLYRSLPTWRECVCIVVHDWGYWGCAAMDDAHGERHPEVGASIVSRLLGRDHADLVLLHSRHLARSLGREPSRLCWADKLSIAFEPWWLYLPRAWLSGELAEYRAVAARTGYIQISASHRAWHRWVRDGMVKVGKTQRADAMTYMTPRRPR